MQAVRGNTNGCNSNESKPVPFVIWSQIRKTCNLGWRKNVVMGLIRSALLTWVHVILFFKFYILYECSAHIPNIWTITCMLIWKINISTILDFSKDILLICITEIVNFSIKIIFYYTTYRSTATWMWPMWYFFFVISRGFLTCISINILLFLLHKSKFPWV